MRILKITGLILIVLLAAAVGTCSYFSKDLPLAQTGPNAEKVADLMWQSLNKTAWDSTRYVSWSFRGEHHYKWDKAANLAEISWDENRVLLNPDQVDGLAYVNGEKQEKSSALIQTAWEYWCNDMYWLVAPFKIRDTGTSLALTADNRLVVTYESGGVTPGDSYVWTLDENNVPQLYEMFVKIIPVKGLSATWENWTTLSTGAKIATKHTIAGSELSLSPVNGGMSLSDIDLEADIWAEIR